MAQYGKVQPFLAFEVIVDGRQAQAGALGNILDTRSAEAVSEKYFGCRCNQAAARVFARGVARIRRGGEKRRSWFHGISLWKSFTTYKKNFSIKIDAAVQAASLTRSVLT